MVIRDKKTTTLNCQSHLRLMRKDRICAITNKFNNVNEFVNKYISTPTVTFLISIARDQRALCASTVCSLCTLPAVEGVSVYNNCPAVLFSSSTTNSALIFNITLHIARKGH